MLISHIFTNKKFKTISKLHHQLPTSLPTARSWILSVGTRRESPPSWRSSPWTAGWRRPSTVLLGEQQKWFMHQSNHIHANSINLFIPIRKPNRPGISLADFKQHPPPLLPASQLYPARTSVIKRNSAPTSQAQSDEFLRMESKMLKLHGNLLRDTGIYLSFSKVCKNKTIDFFFIPKPL